MTDLSWALINSVTESFNKFDISTYLKWTFEFLLKNEITESVPKTKLYLCSTHFLKNILKKTKRIVKDSNYQFKNDFIFMFSLLQNSLSIKEFNAYLLNIYNVFKNKIYDDSVRYSLEILRSHIKDRDLIDQKNY